MGTGIDEQHTLEALQQENRQLGAELRQLRESDRVYRTLFDNAPVLISTKDLNGVVLMANHHFEVLDGFEAGHVVGKSVFDLFPPEIAHQLWHNDQRAAREMRAIHEEENVYHRDKTLHTYMTVKFPLFDASGKVAGTGAVSTDITEAKKARNDSVTDELTGLKNRRYFNMRFLEEQRRAHRDGRILTLLLADVDHFKGYNDSYGHPQGDAVLMSVAHTIRRTLNRPGDLVFRIGGDEFACLYTCGHEQESMELADHIRAAVVTLAIPHSANAPFGHVTLSLGLVLIHADTEMRKEQAYELGDQALYRAKHLGRNTVSR
ncbi:MAG: GGDEF domain-containing protein [Pseudomonadota bacterium]